MAKAGHGYPQVVARAADLMDGRVITLSARRSVERALAAMRSAHAVIVTDGVRRAGAASGERRAREWPRGRRRWADLAWTNVPMLSGSADEISARRLVKAGASIVLVRDGRRVIGAIRRAAKAGPSLAGKLERLQGAAADARLWLLRAAGKLGEAHGHAVYAAGGVVRDLVRGRDADQMADLDLVVEDDGIAFARRLGEEIGGHLVLHTAFGTASIEGGVTPDGTRLPRVDIATARRERYPRPGALPEVSPAGIEEDLERRDFSVNAMAMALPPSAWGQLHDPHGGAEDVLAGRLRVLHPLALAEDPTRIWRGARSPFSSTGERSGCGTLRIAPPRRLAGAWAISARSSPGRARAASPWMPSSSRCCVFSPTSRVPWRSAASAGSPWRAGSRPGSIPPARVTWPDA